MNKLLYLQLNKERFSSELFTTLKFVMFGVLWIVASDMIVFFSTRTPGYLPIFHVEVVKGIAFVIIMGAIFFFVLLKHEGGTHRIDQDDFFMKNPQPMWIVSLDTLKFLEVNEAAENIYGYSRAEFLTMKICDIAPAHAHAAMKDSVTQLQNGYRLIGRWELVQKNAEAVHVDVSSYSFIFHHEHAGLIITHDVSTSVRMERELAETKASFEKAVSEKTISLMVRNRELQHRNNEVNANNDDLISLNRVLMIKHREVSAALAQAIQEKNDHLRRLYDHDDRITASFDLVGNDSFISKGALDFFTIADKQRPVQPNFWLAHVAGHEMEDVMDSLQLLEQRPVTSFSCHLFNSADVAVQCQITIEKSEQRLDLRIALRG